MSKKIDFIIALNSLKEHFNINDINDYRELINIFNTININKESDEDILNCFSEIINLISLKQEYQKLHPNDCNQEYSSNTSIDNLPDNENFLEHTKIFQELFKRDIFMPLNADYRYTNILRTH